MKDNIVKSYIKGSFEELTKVTWPTKNTAVRLTIVTLVFCLIFALFLGVTDFILNEAYTYLLTQAR